MADRRKNPDRHRPSPTVLHASAELSAENKRVIRILLGKFGVKANFLSPDLFEARMRKQYASILPMAYNKRSPEEVKTTPLFADITSPDQFIVREHLEDFKATYPLPGLKKPFVGVVFNLLVDANGSRHDMEWYDAQRNVHYRDPKPPEGVEVVERTEAGFEPYPKLLDRYGKSRLCSRLAVRASGVVGFADHLTATHEFESMTSAQRGVILVAEVLQEQFQT